MPQSLAQVYLHIVYSTKHRNPFLKDPAVRDSLFSYLATVCKSRNSPCIKAGGVEDHVHLLVRFGRSISIADLIKELKRTSSIWIKNEFHLRDFEWQNGYGAFSISPAHVDALTRYIANQIEHHRKETFQQEFRRLLKKYGLEWDEEYVWD